MLSFLFLVFFNNLLSVENGASIYTVGYKVVSSGNLCEPSFNIRNSFYYTNVDLHTKSGDRTAQSSLDSLYDFLNLTYVPKLKFLDANIGLTGLASMAYQTVNYVRTTPTSTTTITGNRSGVGDSAFAVTLGWHCKKSFHFLISAVTFFPTGVYDANRVGNIGKNRYALDPEVGLTWFFAQDWSLSTLWGYTINFENRKTHYKSGDELHVEYCISKHLKEGSMFGLGGYWVQQLTNDSGTGASSGAFKGKQLALGPVFSYTKQRFTVMAKHFHDFDANNHVKGDKFFLEGILKF
jgi:hypothetical protein